MHEEAVEVALEVRLNEPRGDEYFTPLSIAGRREIGQGLCRESTE